MYYYTGMTVKEEVSGQDDDDDDEDDDDDDDDDDYIIRHLTDKRGNIPFVTA